MQYATFVMILDASIPQRHLFTIYRCNTDMIQFTLMGQDVLYRQL